MIKRTSRWIIHRPVRFLVPVSFRIHRVFSPYFSPYFFPYFSPHFSTLFSGRTRKQGRRITPPALPCFTGSSCRHITCLISRVFSSCYPQFRSQAASISFRCRPPLLQVAAGLPLPGPAGQPFLPFFRFRVYRRGFSESLYAYRRTRFPGYIQHICSAIYTIGSVRKRKA